MPSSSGVACSQRHDRRASIDHKVDAAAIDPAIDVKMALGVARNYDRSRTRIRGGGSTRAGDVAAPQTRGQRRYSKDIAELERRR